MDNLQDDRVQAPPPVWVESARCMLRPLWLGAMPESLAPPLLIVGTLPPLEVRRSVRRRRTVLAYRDGDRIIVLVSGQDDARPMSSVSSPRWWPRCRRGKLLSRRRVPVPATKHFSLAQPSCPGIT